MGVNLMVRPYFATGVRGSARPGIRYERRYLIKGEVLLISWEISSLIIDRLCKQVMREKAAVACFYFDFVAQEEQSPAAILGSVLKQVVAGLEEISEGIIMPRWKGINPNTLDTVYQTLLSWATGNARE